MSRINVILGSDVNYGFKGGARYNTVISDTSNRLEDRASLWMWPKFEFDASYGYLTDEARDVLLAAFHACKGRLHSFMFKDWNDYTIEAQPFQVGAFGTKAPVQLYKLYTFGAAYIVRPIQAAASCTITDGAGVNVPGTLDPLTGVFTPTNDWGAGLHHLTVQEFYAWVRFDDDYNPMTLEAPNASTASVSLVEDPFELAATNLPSGWAG